MFKAGFAQDEATGLQRKPNVDTAKSTKPTKLAEGCIRVNACVRANRRGMPFASELG